MAKRQRLAVFASVLWLLIWLVAGYAIVKASSFIQTPNISTGEPAINRAVVCSQTTVYCYAIGGGADFGSASNVVNKYNRDTDTVGTGTTLPADAMFPATLQGAWQDRIVASSTSTVTTKQTYIYNETLDSWITVSNPTSTAVSNTAGMAGQYYYWFEISGDIFDVYRLNLQNTAAGFSLIDVASGWSGYTMQYAKAIYDPAEQKFLIIMSPDGETASYNIVSGAIQYVSSAFPPCDAAGACMASVTFYDADLGVVAGKQGTPGATSIGLYAFDWVTDSWSSSTVDNMVNANFNTSQFTAAVALQPETGYVTDEATGITYVLFGSSKTYSAAPGYNANLYFYRRGDPGGVTTNDKTIDTWVHNFLASMGMDSSFGQLLVGSLFIMAIFIFLAVKGVPWILSLGLAGLATTFLTAAALLDVSVLLVLSALVMFGGMGLIFALFNGKSGNSG